MFTRKGQSTLEYALIIAVVVAGLLLMQHYVRRGYAGRLKSASDDIGDQYDPTAYSGTFQITQNSASRATIQNRQSGTTQCADSVSSRTGQDHVTGWAVNAASSTLFDR